MAKLVTQEICARLGAEFCVRTFSSCPSTNIALLEAAKQGALPRTLFVTAEQTNGRGRLGRSFFSPKDSGVYFSLLLQPTEAQSPAVLTALSALAVCEAAEALGAADCSIKWVNDVYRNGKKCCGILTQGVYENARAVYAVVGIGANLVPPKTGFPADIKDRAGAFFAEDAPLLRERFTAEVTRRICEFLSQESSAFVPAYRARLNLLGKQVEVLRGEERFFATAHALQDDFSLLVQRADGAFVTLQSGEVTLVL